MRRNTMGMASMLALMVGAGGRVAPSEPPLARDEKQERRQRRSHGWGIPYPNLHHVSRETLNLPPKGRRIIEAGGDIGHALAAGDDRDARRAGRRRRMKLRKLRGWR
jgi:hypothetical protein